MQDIDLNGHHQTTLDGIFRHPIDRNLEWHDVSSLLGRLGTITERKSGMYDVQIGTNHIVIERPADKNLEVEELSRLQSFLRSAGLDPATIAPATSRETNDGAEELDCVVLIDHAQARLFMLHGDDAPGRPSVLTPSDAHDFHRHIQHRGTGNQDGRRGAEDVDYYERVANDLKTAARIVILTDGKGNSSAGGFLVGYLGRHHPEIAQRVVMSENVQVSRLTDREIVAEGRKLLAPLGVAAE